MSSAATINASGKAALILREKLGADKVILPDDALPDVGQFGTTFYFIAQAAQIVPVCRVLPVNAADVAAILNIVRETGATFAVKSGGHNSYASGNNAENGITIDLSRLKYIDISDDRKSVTVGAGCRFGEIYDKLEAHGLGCVGGRISSVGVSGLTMGGGISFFSSERGLACDNVISYELVLANGQILNVSEKSHPDLFWGMRGAGITLGIVTRMELRTFNFEQIWGGASIFAHENKTAVFNAFNKFVQDGSNPSTEAFMLSTDAAKDGNNVYAVITSHSNPQSDTAAFDDIKSLTPLASTTQIRSLKNLCDEMDSQNEPGFRFRTSSLSVKFDLSTLEQIDAIHKESVALLKDCDGFVPSILYQPLLRSMLPRDEIGNALGIKPEDTPLIIIAILWRWTDIQHDKMIFDVADQFVDKVEKAARAQGTFYPYQYLNYAARHQDVYGSYGEENRKRLLEIKAKYDPEDLMSTLRPGIIQLSGSQKA
ncbi:FAD binding domain protein [Trichoderma guizhouense]|uniref:FAD binding domain protein n=1 Tax=Trichoderma guizhouense TaxID=1491466 RepID=A0A1T3CJ54_9HYPO|nr:FAD binding domain protein [Trichoderma guizhouense]